MRAEIDFVLHFTKICTDFSNEEFWIRNETYLKQSSLSVKLKKYPNLNFEKKVNKHFFWKVIKSPPFIKHGLFYSIFCFTYSYVWSDVTL